MYFSPTPTISAWIKNDKQHKIWVEDRLSGGLGTMGIAGAVFVPSDVQRNQKVAGLNIGGFIKKNTYSVFCSLWLNYEKNRSKIIIREDYR
jgi:hypothetical protein